MTRQGGVTLLEAIIALTLMATGALALFTWMGAQSLAFDRVAARASELSLERSALAVVKTINPAEEPRGRREIEGMVVEWQATTISGPVPGRLTSGPLSAFDLTLFQVDATYTHPILPSSRQLSLRKTGWKTVRFTEGGL